MTATIFSLYSTAAVSFCSNFYLFSQQFLVILIWFFDNASTNTSSLLGNKMARLCTSGKCQDINAVLWILFFGIFLRDHTKGIIIPVVTEGTEIWILSHKRRGFKAWKRLATIDFLHLIVASTSSNFEKIVISYYGHQANGLLTARAVKCPQCKTDVSNVLDGICEGHIQQTILK